MESVQQAHTGVTVNARMNKLSGWLSDTESVFSPCQEKISQDSSMKLPIRLCSGQFKRRSMLTELMWGHKGPQQGHKTNLRCRMSEQHSGLERGCNPPE